jgi:uncharacterized protein (DUF736 family)
MKKYYSFASGWVRKKGNGEEYISCAANGEKATVKLLAQLGNGKTIPIDNFAIFFDAEKKHDKSPDVRCTFSVEE